MDMKRLNMVAALACLGMAGMSAPVAAESGVLVPRGPVLSTQDPVFMGLLLSPGTSQCRQLTGRWEWKCSYGRVPRAFDRNNQFGDAELDQQGVGAKPAKTKLRSRTTARR